METLRRDLLGAVRGWRRTPGPVLAAAGALTLAIAANTTIFSVVSGVLLADRADSEAAFVVNESLARRYWGDRSPIGQRVRVTTLEGAIVGVVKDIHHRGP